MLRKEKRSRFRQYLRELLSSWWGWTFLLLGLGSTATTYIGSFYPGFVLPRWILIAISAVAWVLAPYDLYRRQRAQIEGQAKLRLVIHPESDSRYYVHMSGHLVLQVTGMYLELYVNLENKGSRNAILKQFDLSVKETGRRYENIRPQPRSMLQTQTHQTAMRTNFILREGSVCVPAFNFLSGIIPFYLDAAAAPTEYDQQYIHCTLAITDSEGNKAEREIEALSGG